MADTEQQAELDPTEATPEQHNQPADNPATETAGNVVQLDSENGLSGLSRQIAGMEAALQALSEQQQLADQQLQTLHGQQHKLSGNFDIHLDLTNRKLQAVLEKYTGLKSNAEQLATRTTDLQNSLDSSRNQTEALFKSLDTDTRQRIESADRALRDLLSQEAEQTRQRHQALLDQLTAEQQRLSTLEHKAERLGEELSSRAKVLQQTIASVEARLQQELQRIDAQARARDEALHKETIRLREAGAMQARRNQTHEARTGRLEQRNEQLERRANLLEDDAVRAETRNDLLENTAVAHSAQLEQLSTRARAFNGVLLLVLLVLGLVAFYLHNSHRQLGVLQQHQADTSRDLTKSLHKQQAALLQRITDDRATLDTRIDQKTQQLAQTNAQLQQALSASQQQLKTQQQATSTLRNQIANLQDQASSAGGRLAALYPLGNYGTDNTIHRAAWLSHFKPAQLLVRLTEVDDRQALYDIADRWSYYLEGRYLVYVKHTEAGKTVYALYYGPFDSSAAADQFISQTPTPDYDVPMTVTRVQALQQQVGKSASN